MANLTAAQTILTQLGGHKFLVMTGAKNLLGDASSLTMDIPAHMTRNHANKFRITLAANDTYTLDMIKYRPSKLSFAVLESIADVYADHLRANFESMTGLICNLGTMGV